jgi:hypothetical protein
MNNFAHDIAVISRSLDLKDRRIAELEAMLATREPAPYPNDALTEVCKLLLDDWDLTPGQIANLAADLPAECDAHLDERNEAAWERQQERMESGGPDDSAYRRDIIAAGRGHLLP